jgi:formate-dependent phosphoribosylglycinamide formyltransferase (GAR transformylase)
MTHDGMERTMLADDEGQWMYVLDAQRIGGVIICDGYVGDPGTPMSQWAHATVKLDADDLPEVIEVQALAWDNNDNLIGDNT